MNVNTTYVLDGVQNFRILQRLCGCIAEKKDLCTKFEKIIIGPLY